MVSDKHISSFLALSVVTREALIVNNRGLVHYAVSFFKEFTSFIPFDDLVGYGMEGLIIAAHKFDPGRGVKFSTFAMWWIRQAIGRHIANDEQTIRIPVNQYGDRESLKSIREETGVSSLDVLLSEGGDGSVAVDRTLVVASPEDITHDMVLAEKQNDAVELLERELSEGEWYVLKHYVMSGNSPSLENVGQALKVSRERVRQIKISALKNAKNILRVNGMSAEDLL